MEFKKTLILIILFGILMGSGFGGRFADDQVTPITVDTVTDRIKLNGEDFTIIYTPEGEPLFRRDNAEGYWSQNNHYIDINGYIVNQNGEFINDIGNTIAPKFELFRLESKGNQLYRDFITQFQNNPLIFPERIRNYLISQETEPNSQGMEKIYSTLFDNQMTIINEQCAKNPTDDKCKNAKNDIESINNFLNSLSPQGRLAYMNANMAACGSETTPSPKCKKLTEQLRIQDCGTGWDSSICNWFNFKTNDMLLEQQTYAAIADATKATGTMEEYNKALKAVINTQIVELETKKNACSNDGACIKKIEDMITTITQAAEKKTMVKTNAAYSIINAIKNPDENAMKTAKLFGFEANYENVPVMLRESMASQMCLDKIDGYLDKEIETNGGVTKYGCDSINVSTNPDDHCLEVMGDLRAQRSDITPDNKTLVTYSYYVKNPQNPFSLTVKYVENGNWKVFSLENSSSSKGFDSVNIQLDSRDNVEPNSFTINLDTGDLHLTYPIILISTGALKSTIETNGNAAGNEGANINANING